MTLQVALIALIFFQLKHLIADFVLQSPKIVAEKGRYGRAGGLWHAIIHVVASAPILLFLKPGIVTVVIVLATEFLVHYHIDWIKATHARRTGLAPQNRLFWITLGIDQALHQLTYIAIIWYIAL